MQQALDNNDAALTIAGVEWDKYAPALVGVRANKLIDTIAEARAAVAAMAEAGGGADGSTLAGRLAGKSEAEIERSWWTSSAATWPVCSASPVRTTSSRGGCSRTSASTR